MLSVIKRLRVMLYSKNLCTHEMWPFSHLMWQSVEEIYKVASISLSPNVPAQIFVSSFYSFPPRFMLLARKYYCDLNLAINFSRTSSIYLILLCYLKVTSSLLF